MAALAGILNHSSLTAGQALSGTSASPMAAAASSSSSSSSSSSATITANDFLTLLVTEMKNQDPTATTDPNEYINQLVQVNSLQQLISINQTVTKDLGSTTTKTGSKSDSSDVSAQATDSSSQKSKLTAAEQAASDSSSAHHTALSASLAGAQTAVQQATNHPVSVNGGTQFTALKRSPGNLSLPGTNPSASRVANSLSGQH